MEADGRPLRNSFEHDVTISNFTVPIATWEWMDTAHAAAVTNDVAVFRNLEKERPALFRLSVFPVHVLNEKNAPFLVELNFAIDKIRCDNLNGLTSHFLCDHVDRFLRERVP